jgi:transposase
MVRCTAKITVRKIREILRLKLGDPIKSNRFAGTACGVSSSTVSDILLRFRAAGLDWPLPSEMTDQKLEAKLYNLEAFRPTEGMVVPDWAIVRAELGRKNVTLALLWQEYKVENDANGFSYSWFCERFQHWQRKLKTFMRQTHKYGEKCFVDFAGTTMPIDPVTGEVRQAAIFVAVLGGSSYTFAEAVLGQDVASWLRAHDKMCVFFGGISEVIVPDNLKSAINKASFYDPEINLSYAEWSEHHGVVILPARVRRPKDKAKAEAGVQVVQRWILARLRNVNFYCIDDLNEAIDGLLVDLNRRPMKKLGVSRELLFLEREKAALRPLPVAPYAFGLWLGPSRVAFDYHIMVEERAYSVPYTYADKKVTIRVGYSVIEVFYERERIASHRRCRGTGLAVTLAEHMPSHHRAVASWNAERILNWAGEFGPSVREFCDLLMQHRQHPEQGFRACLGVLRLAKKFGKPALHAACAKAIRIRAYQYSSVKSILSRNLQDQKENEPTGSPAIVADHENIRGPEYFEKFEAIYAATNN